MIDVPIELIWDDFLYWQAKTGHYQRRQKENPYLKPMKATPERLALMSELKDWCVKRNIAVRQWLFTLFAIRRWLYAPRLETGYLCSEKHLPRYRKFRDYRLYTIRLREMENADPVIQLEKSFDPNRDINHTVELTKQKYLETGRTDLCVEGMNTETFGYHPKSKICAKCPIKQDCKNKLVASVNFDIMKLRRGEITSEQAYRAAMQVRGYGS